MAKMERPDLEGAVWLRREALAEGHSGKTIDRLVRTGEWRRVRRGAYTSGELWSSLTPEDRHRLLCRAALKTAHPTSVLSHVSSAIEWGAAAWGIDLDEVHMTRTDGKAGRRESGIAHHRGVLHETGVVVINGVKVTGAARALVETCTVVAVEPALITANSVLHLGATTMEEFAAEAEAATYWPHSLTADLVLRMADPRLESAAESRAFFLFWRHHIPRPVPQLEVRDEAGRLLGRADFAWPDLGAYAEIDGRAKYLKHRRPGESLDQFLMREKRREELICQVTGWVCIRISWADLEHPELLARRIRKILQSGRQPSAGA